MMFRIKDWEYRRSDGTQVAPNQQANIRFSMERGMRIKRTMFPHHNIHKFTWTSPDGKSHNQIDHIFTDMRRHSNALCVQSFRGEDCDTDHYLVMAKVRGRLVVIKQITHRFYMERFNLRKLNETEGKEQYRVETSNRFTALEKIDDEANIERAWETIRENK
jgi:hypothetical protein